MAILAEQIDIWRRLPSESERLEFKEAKNQFDNQKLYQYCVAMANEGGGSLVLGVGNSHPRKVVGTKAFDNPIAMSEKIFQALGFRVDIEEVAHPDGRVVVFQIPGRPRGTAFSLEGSYWMRCGESLVPMSEDRLRKIFAEGEPDWLEEPAARKVTGERVLELIDTEGFFKLLNLSYPATMRGVLDRLLTERLVDAEVDGTYAIRRIGAILLARSLDAFPDVKRKAARVVVYQGASKIGTTTIDRFAVRGYAVGFQLLVHFVNRQLPQNEIIKDARR